MLAPESLSRRVITTRTDGAANTMAAADATAEGTVKKIDKSAGKLTIAHDLLETAGTLAMTMVFRAADAGMLDQVKVGDKIRFAAGRVDGALTVTALEAAP